MKLSQLTLAIAIATVPMTGAFAAALDRSGQSMNAFFQDGNYFEAGISVLDPTVSGKESSILSTTREIADMGESYMFPTAAIKLQPHEKVSIGLLYDQPYGAEAEYSGNNIFVSKGLEDTNNLLTTFATPAAIKRFATQQGITLEAAQRLYNSNKAIKRSIDNRIQRGVKQVSDNFGNLLGDDNEGTKVEVHTQSLSLVLGYQPTQNWNFYAGPVYQTVKGDVKLRGSAYSLYNGYDANIPETGAWGWLAGTSFQIPDIALRASLTYRSEIKHNVVAQENLSAYKFLTHAAANQVLSGLGLSNQDFINIQANTDKTTITTPQSVNLDLQSGVAPDTLAFINFRWVDWSKFAIQPNQFGLVSQKIGSAVARPDGFNLVEYSKDQYSVTAGVGRKFTDKWTGSVAAGWDSGAGNPVSTLGPTEGYWNLGVGVQYSPQKNYFIAGGVKHFWLGDAKAQTGAQAGTEKYVAEFKDNKAWAYGLKIGYKF